MRARAVIAALAFVVLAPSTAAADAPVVVTPLAPQVLHVPTAWLQPRDTVFGSAGANHRGGGFVRLTAGLGTIADVDVEVTDRFDAPWVGTAGIKLGAPEDAWFEHQPAIAIGMRRSFGERGLEVAEAFAVASARAGGVRAHLGATTWQALARGDDAPSAPALRPFAAVEWTPAPYPRTTLLADLSWAPRLAADRPLGWLAGWGVRYQALDWGSIELAVRHREGDGLDGATVFVRVAGVLSLR